MSLVHDALQKAEREKQRRTGEITPPTPVNLNVGAASVPRTVPPPPRSTPAATTPSPRRQVFPIFVAAVVVIAVGFLAWTILRRQPALAGAAPAAPSVPIKEIAVARPEPRPPAETPTAPPADDPAYKLTGIMKNPDGTPCAIINGRVVSEDNYVDGATVKKIEKDRVTLDVNGRGVVKRLY